MVLWWTSCICLAGPLHFPQHHTVSVVYNRNTSFTTSTTQISNASFENLFFPSFEETGHDMLVEPTWEREKQSHECPNDGLVRRRNDLEKAEMCPLRKIPILRGVFMFLMRSWLLFGMIVASCDYIILSWNLSFLCNNKEGVVLSSVSQIQLYCDPKGVQLHTRNLWSPLACRLGYTFSKIRLCWALWSNLLLPLVWCSNPEQDASKKSQSVLICWTGESAVS